MKFRRFIFIALFLMSFLPTSFSFAKEVSLGEFKGISKDALEDGIPSTERLEGYLNKVLSGDTNSENACLQSSDPALIGDKGDCPGVIPECGTFVGDLCALGPSGRQVRSLFSKSFKNRSGATVSYGHYIDSPPRDIGSVCKNYDALDRETKETFWIWVLMQMSTIESQCNTLPGTNRPGYAGAFQMESSSGKRNEMRPEVCHNEVIKRDFAGIPKELIGGKSASIYSLPANIRCAMAIFAVQLAEPGSENAETEPGVKTLSRGLLYTDSSYWEPLLDHGKWAKVSKTQIKRFGPCGN